MKGKVIKSTGSWYQVLNKSGEIYDCRIKGKFRIKGIMTTNPISVGDNVEFEIETKENIGIINLVEERKNYIIRKSVNLSKQSHIIASNIDQAILVVTVANPKTSTGFIDRFLTTAEAYHISSILIFNKTDSLSDIQRNTQSELKEIYETVGYTCIEISALRNQNTKNVIDILHNKISLISGHSGVGKSTLVNTIEPGLDLKTSEISSVHSKGTHTTTFAQMFPLSFGGFIIDTPGIKEFGLIDIKKEELSHYFPEMRKLISECQFNNCLHLNEPKCAVKDAVRREEIAESRYNSYLSILSSEEMQSEYNN